MAAAAVAEAASFRARCAKGEVRGSTEAVDNARSKMVTMQVKTTKRQLQWWRRHLDPGASNHERNGLKRTLLRRKSSGRRRRLRGRALTKREAMEAEPKKAAWAQPLQQIPELKLWCSINEK